MVLDRATVLFDVDGTIAETEGDGHLHAFNQAFQEFEVPWTWSTEVYGELLKITGGFERMMAYAQNIGADWALTEAGQARFRSIHRCKNERYAKRLESGLIAPRAGFVDLIQKLQAQGQRWGVVTTTSASNWQALWRYAITRSAPLPEPAVVICGEDVICKKPDPEAYVLALHRLGIAAADAIAIEDSRNGLIAARAAGIESVVVRSRFFGHQEFPEARLVVNELSELL
ncbi:MAG: HAD-IA family hydrolase [Burkholderiaceae bacterium]|nr:HAD-IA family hydrolase [Burkholderiaceae bacterium]